MNVVAIYTDSDDYVLDYVQIVDLITYTVRNWDALEYVIGSLLAPPSGQYRLRTRLRPDCGLDYVHSPQLGRFRVRNRDVLGIVDSIATQLWT